MTEDIYPLSPVQEGMVFHDLYAPGSGAYVSQYVFTLRGAVDVEVLGSAWEHVLEGCAVLRTVFVWEGMARPVQAVLSRAELPWEVLDWRHASAAEQQERMLAYLEAQRVRGFDLLRAPLMRLALVWTGDEEVELVWSHHHLLLDGWSISLVLQDVLISYDALLRGAAPALPRRRRYRDYIAWLLRQDLGAAEAYWRGSLEDFTSPTPLPAGGPEGAAAGEPPREGGADRQLSASATAALLGFAKQHRVTTNTLVQGAWALLLSRYAGEEDVVFGAVVTGRPPELPGMEQMIGLFINTLPVRAQVDPGAPVVGWLQWLQTQQREARSYEYSPLSAVQQWSGVAGGQPLFESIVAFENHPVEEMAGAGARAFVVEDWARMGRSHYPLGLMVLPGERLSLRVEYHAGRLDAAAAERLAGQMETVLHAMTAAPGRRLSEVSLLSAPERAQVLEAWNATALEVPGMGSVHELFSARAARTPDAAAVVFEDRSLTYAELDGVSSRLANHLRGLGVGPEARVGLCLERGVELAVAVLGILKAGGAYVPLDPANPAERLLRVLDDAGARVAVTAGAAAARLDGYAGALVRLDADAERIAQACAQAPKVAVSPRNLAYVIYTSGSTGRPKGVMVEHRSIVNLHAALESAVYARRGAEAPPRVSVNGPASFDTSVKQLVQLLGGATLCVIPEEARYDADALGAYLRAHAVEVLDCTPAQLRALLAEGLLEKAGPALTDLLVAGEAIDAELWRTLEGLEGRRAWNLYGPTECTVDAALCRVEGARPVLGRGIGNVRLYVLDASGEPQPAGVPGELYVGGAGVARGYAGAPELTAGRFVPDGFSGELGARMYRTGDRVRWLADGTVEYLGRTDFQVKVRGFRIEPGEIEAALLDQAQVGEAVVVVREDAPGDRRLVAYVVPEAGAEPTAAELRTHLRERLPEQMIPAAFVLLERLPLTSNAKVDRRALPAPEHDSTASRAPRSPTEEVLAGIWAEVLRAERVGVEESFFELGGHSLLATQVVSRIRAVFGTEVPLRSIFEAPTVAALAALVEAQRGVAAGVAPPTERAPRTGPLPLSFAQQRLWLVDRLEPGSAAYNMAGALRLRGALDTAALRASLDALVARHEALRTAFAERGGAPVQVIHPPAPAALPVLDLRDVPDAEAEAQRLVVEEALRPFDLARGPLLRCTLLRLGEADHVLLFTMHHVVSDGWSMQVLVREVSTLYAAYSRGETPRLPELPVQYADFAVWQREWLSGETLAAQIGYWRERLAGAPPLLEIPVDRPRTADAGAQAASHRFALSAEATQGLRTLSRREGATLFMTLLAGWQTLLGRYAGQDDVVVGTPIAGRTLRETEGLIGFFVNMLALRADLSGDPAWAELLRRTREAALDAYAHQELPFEKLVEELDVVRSLAHTPLFQATFALDRGEAYESLALGDVAVERFGAGGQVAKFDLELSFRDDEDVLAGVLQYRTALFEADTVARMAAHLEAVLESMAAEPARRISELALLRGDERAQVLHAWNATEADFPQLSLHELVSAQAARTPGAVAVVFEGETLTYAELEARASRLAHHLLGLGVRPETRVGVCAERSADLVVALLGTLKAGAAYVPLDPSYPAERLAYMLADSGVPVLLTQERLLERLPEHAAQVVCLDRDAERLAAECAAPPAPRVDPDGLAYVIYTSGSTGKPKGAMNAHRGIVNRLLWMQEQYGLGVDDVVLQKTPFSFDVSVWEFFWPLLTGAPLVLAKPAGHGDPVYLSELIERETVTTLHFVPSMLLAFLEAGEPARCGTLRRVMCSGEALPYELTERFRAALPGVELHNLYGPTEAAVDVTFWAAEPRVNRVVPIGRPVANTRLYVLDAMGQPVPVGVPGELFLGGVQVGRGYLGRPELTAEKFVPDAFSAEPGARLYRTGDRVRWSAEGEVEYLGRIDFQVKVRGFRIELGEIETALREQAGVREAVVLVREDVPGERRLVAYVVPREGGELSAEALKARLHERLPEYMVPGALVALERLPLSPNGKVDRRALPAPQWSAAAYVAPRTATEEVLAGIWAELLGVERVGAEESFFELGGHSLLATRVVSRVRQTLGIELPLRSLFEAPTIAALAGRIDALRGAGATAAPPIERVSRDEPLPLSFAQQRLWLVDRLEPGSAAYNMPAALRLHGALDTDALRASLDALVERHETLRTVFAEGEDGPVQVIHAPAPVALVELDLRDAPDAKAEAERLAAGEALRPFDLARGPLLRCTLLRLTDDEHVLLFTMHHVVSDGWSMQVLVREVSTLYAAYSRGETPRLPELPVQYADFAVWQREWLSGETLAAQIGYWRERLAGAPPLLEIPVDRPRTAGAGAQAASHRFALSAEATQGLRTLSRREGVTLFMTLLAGWQALLGRYAGQDDVVVGTPIAGRTRAELEGLVGFFVNMLALRADLSQEPSWAGLLAQVRETALGAYAHQELPFEKLVEELEVERSLAHTPLFQATFALDRGEAYESLALGDVAVERLGAGGQVAKFDLELSLHEGGEALAGVLRYRASLFDPETAVRMAAHLETLLEAMASGPERRLSEPSLLRGDERAQVLESWNATAADYPQAVVHELVSAQAARTPHAAAVRFRGEVLSYADLEARSNRLARHLRRLGVGPEARVGVCLERTPELVVALLGVLKAGGAYVPLDPAHPRERLAHMREDAGLSLVLTSSALAGVLPEGTRTLALDAVGPAIEAESDAAPETGVEPENLSHVIFTSGSTGRPKGVMIRHSSVVVLLHWLRENVSDEERSAVLFSTSVNFDVSVAEVFGTLAWGGTLVLVENALELAGLEEPVVHASMVPTAAAELLRMGGIPASVRTLNLGGEALPNDLAQALYALGTVEKVGNLYGPTEDTTYSTYSLVERGTGRVLVGRPVANTQALVLDAELEPVPVGVIGELYLAGNGLSRGYAGRPELTAERYLPNPFGAAGSRMYRVMDRVRWLASGELEYFGRTDFQVKVRGFRIELGEIECALRTHPSVCEAVATVREDAPGALARRIVAYVVAAVGATVEAAWLRAHLRERLPEYMVPSAVVVLEALPLSPNGKLDRRALPAPQQETKGYVAPRTPVEEVLAGIWAETLGVERVGVEESFFELGGHSLLATRVVSRVREVFGVEVPLRALFEAPTIAALAGRIEALRSAGAAAAPPIERVSRDEPLPLSFAQQRLWLVDRLQPGSAAYNMPAALRLRGVLDTAALRASLEALVERHETLRTVFAESADGPVQVIHPPAPVVLPVLDLRDAPDAEGEAERLAAGEALRPFDLSRGPLLRSTLLRLADDEHVLLFTLHHVVSDGWSMEVLVREVSALYAAFSRGETPRLPELPVQYADFAVWQRNWLQGDVLEAQIGYWKDRLAGAPPLLELPTDRPRSLDQSPLAGRHPFGLSPELSDGLRALSRAVGTTLFMTVLAAWQSLLGRWAGQEDVVVGSPIAGRTRRETEGLVGFFVNMLALRADLSAEPAGSDLLGQVRETALGAYAHQELPFERLVDELAVERSLIHTPVFQATFALNRSAGSDALPRLGEVEVEPFAAGDVAAKFDLGLAISDVGEALGAELQYRAALFDEQTVARMAAHLELLLEALADDPARPLAEVSLLRGAERAQVLETWNDTVLELPRSRIHDLFAAQARRTPEAVAVIHGGEALTYAELDAHSSRLAHALRRRGVAPETRVGLCVERTPEMLVGMLGVLRAGGAYVPLDPALPAERLAWLMEDAGVRVLLTQERLRERVAGFAGPVLRLDADWPEVAAEPREALESGVAPENLAYVIYTSGSTGTPKGVQVEHRSTVALLGWLAAQVRPEERACVLASTSISFDVSVAELFDTLGGGGTLVLVDNALELATVPVEADVRLAYMVPTAAAELLRTGGIPASLRTLNLAGEALPAELAQALYGAGVARVLNIYGPTEDTVYATCGVVERGAERITIGRPIANARAYVLDERLSPVPVGIVGELYLAGAGVARGYLGRSGLTAETFVPDLFSAEPGARMYRTGDRVRWTAAGEIEYLGRIDHQVKVRGFRIEPGEIEAALRAHPGVREAVVVVRAEEQRLVGYVVPDDGETLRTVELRDALLRRLPEYMVPSALVVLETLPLTPSGKTDRKALPAPERLEAEGYVAPRTPVEEVLAGLVGEVLGMERVGGHDHFFELGGHSLLATRVVARVRQVLGVELPLRALFEQPTVAALAGRIEALQRAGVAAAQPIGRVSRDEPLPLSFAQQRLWLVDRLEPGSAAYNMPAALRLHGALDVAALRASLDALVARHETLRTVFGEKDGEPVQVVHAPTPVALVELDLRDAPDAIAEAERLATGEALRPFDLSTGPLLRSTLLRLADDEHVLLFTLHHVVSDGWSMDVLTREVSAFYAAFSRGETAVLPELPVQYADFAVWQRRWLSGDVLEAQIGYWKERLAGAPPLLEIPTDHPRVIGQSPLAATHEFRLGAEATQGLRALSRREGVTLFMAVLAGWQALLGRYAGQEDVVVGSPIAGRNRHEIEGLIGFFVNMLPLRADLSGDPTWAELLGRVREAALGAYAHQELPFERLVEELGVERSLTHAPVFQTVFAMGLPRPRRERPEPGELGLEPFSADGHAAKFDLDLVLTDAGEALDGVLIYRSARFEAATIERLARHLEAVLQGLAAEPRRRLSELTLLRGAERRQLLEEWNATATAYPRGAFHEIFAAQAARTPQVTAAAAAGTALTYAELEREANRLAGHLRSRGVGPETRVGICLDRGVELLVAVLGVLKAGGAYVPLDPAYPAERLAFMLADSGAPVLLTRSPLPERLPAFSGEIVCLDAERECIASAPCQTPAVEVDPRAAAYVLYTSGSTGRPKGVVVEHSSLGHFVSTMRRVFHLRVGEVSLAMVSFAFDIWVFEALVPLAAGATVRMLPLDTVRDGGKVVEELRTTGVFNAVPALMRQIVAAARQAGPGPLDGVRWVFSGGEAVTRELRAEMREVFPAALPCVLYGPTEATVLATSHPVPEEDGGPGAALLGRPLPNVRAYVLDAGGSPQPVGVPGELFVGGPGVARGYLGRPELTAERFVPDHFKGAEAPGGRLYRTGDRARWRADGELEYLGRLDTQVKIRGFRVEPGEVELVLGGLPRVREAAVVTREEQLIAYVVPEGGAELSAAGLRAEAREQLPEHMVPSAFVMLERLPLNANGKLDRGALPAPRSENAEYVAPRTPTEVTLAAIWAEVLGVGRVGVSDGFFDLGGHSLLATRVISRVREELDVDVPLRALFETPTVQELAGHVEAERGSERAASTRIPRRAGSGPAPLSFAQQRLWFIHQLDPASSAYNVPHALRLRGALDVAALRRALTELVRRHEAVRTALVVDGGEAVQVVLPAGPVPFPVLDLSGLPGEPRRIEALRRVTEEGGRPFDLTRGPLLRALLVRLADAEWVLSFTMHHIVSDGWSMGVLVREIAALYGAYSRGLESPLPELPLQYADFAAWQRDWLAGERLEEQLRYWRDRLDGAPPRLELPTDYPRRQELGATETGQPFEIPAETTRALRELGQREGATLFMTLMAGWQTLLGRYAGQDDVVVGTPIANRTRAELEGLIGFFVNTLVLRADLADDPDFRGLLRRVRDSTLGAFAHQDLPFERLVEELAPERSLTHNPLFQVMFALLNMEMGALALGDVEMEALGRADAGAKFDLGVTLVESGDRILGRIDYRTDLFDGSTIERLAEHFRRLLEAAVADPGRRLSELRLVGPAEERRLLAEWNPPRVPREARLVPRLFAEQAARTPGAPAVSGAGLTLTYAELDARSSRIAGALRARGVGRETPVGVYVERGPWLLEAVLGIWKAGGAYLPLDPTYPASQLEYMLRDAGAPVLLTQERLRAALPASAGVLLLDGGDALAAGSDAAPAVEPAADQLAYVIYTSGSTGRPKGVRVPHGALARTALAALETFRFAADEVVPSLASFSFDIWLFESVFPLLAGGAVRILPREEVLDVEGLVDGLAGCTSMHAVPALMRQIVLALRAGGRTLPGLRQAFVGGDAVPPDLLEEMREVFPAAAVHVLYGPTEAAIICASHAAGGHGPRRHWVGRALGNAGLYVVDRALQPVPAGVPGELCIGGASAARDYLDRPGLTAEKFIPDPFSSASGARMYRTGDRVRWTVGGELEFLGRVDAQVKIRGFRIEPGEVEAVLGEHPEVRQAAVVVRDAASGQPGDRRLVGYVVPGREEEAAAAPKTEMQSEYVREWESLFDDTYASEAVDEDPAFNVIGWNSSYTGEPIPAAEMRDWVEDAASRIRPLRPRRVLEIGCGTGLLLFRLAPECEEYWAADFSAAAISYLGEQLARPGREIPGVRLLERTADDFSGLPEHHFDLVIINSVAQYFPGVSYLLRVLDGAVGALAPGGTLWVGDVRSLPLLEAFHASVELVQAPGGLSAPALRDRVRRRVLREKELLLDPELFRALPRRLPRVTAVEVRLKDGRHANEMTRFRYDVLLRVQADAPAAAPVWRRWDELGGLEAVGRVLDEEAPDALVVTRVPNLRVAGALAVLEALAAEAGASTVDELRGQAKERESRALDPEDFRALATSRGYRAVARWAARGGPGEFDVLLSRDGSEAPLHEAVASPLPWSAYASDPLASRRGQWLLPELRAWLRERLPDHMVPGSLVVLDALPLTPNGKVDRRALPAPETAAADGAHQAPRTITEEVLSGIWAETLGLDRVGTADNFFELGGHSLLATQVVSRARHALGVEMPLRALFEAPTLAALAERIDTLRGAGAAVAPPIERVPRTAPLPLSFAQQRLWVVDRLEPGSAAYNMPYALRLRGALDVAALRASLHALVARHETLRTTFEEHAAGAGEPVQVVHDAAPVPLPVTDLSRLPAGARHRHVQRLVRTEALRPFDLARGPLLRCALLLLGETDHVLCFTMHHVVSDGWSMDVLVREVSALYAALSRGGEPRLPELPVQYADFAVWQRNWLSGAILDEQIRYWKETLGGAPALLAVPTDRPRSTGLSSRGEGHGLRLPAAVTEGLRAVSRREGATLFMTVLAGWQALLSRYSGQEDLVVGSPIAGRTRQETEGLIGFFVNMLALRGQLGGDPTWSELLGRVRETALGAYAHQELPFERLVDELAVERSLVHSPVFQVVFALNRAGSRDEYLELGEVALEPFGSGSEATKFDLNLALWDGEDGLVGSLLYRTGLYEAETAARMAAHLEALLEAMVADPARRLSDASLLRGAERAQLLHAWSGADTGYTGDLCIHERVHAQVLRTPHAPALRFEGRSLSYAELYRASCRLAQRLRREGVGPEVRVGICMEPALEMVVSVLGVLLAGGAYLPLDPELPAERRAYMLGDASPALLLTQTALADRLESDGVPLLLVDAEAERIAQESDAAPVTGVGPDNLAYVIYTSGSTGRPKGVLVEHRGVGNTFLELGRVYGVQPGERSLAYAPLHFDASVADIFVALCNGAELVLARREAMMPGDDLAHLLRQERITHLKTMPSTLAVTPVEPLPELRTIVTGGEVLPVEQVRRWGEGRRFFNGYGATEASIRMTSSAYTADAGDPPIGRAVDNTQLYVLDSWGEPVPVGVPGEMYIGGVGVVRGYLNRPDLTAERFLPDPYRGVPGARLYRTGDVGRRRADGEVEFLGRTDHQVKVRGYRVELGEIEAVLRGYSQVKEAVVLLREDVPGQPRLVAYVTAEAGAEITAAGLRAHLAERLPEYMVPGVFVGMEQLPVTANGKIDRRALPVPKIGGGAEYEAPTTEMEELLCEIWLDVLGGGRDGGPERVGIHDNFFELGGHSLLATQVVARLRQELKIDLPLRALFEAPTVAALATRVEDLFFVTLDATDLVERLSLPDLVGSSEMAN